MVKSLEAFTDAAADGPRVGRHPGRLLRAEAEDAADDALDVLVDPANLIQLGVTVPEGLRGRGDVETLAKETDFRQRSSRRRSTNPGELGLPGVRPGQPRGLPLPGDLRVPPNADAESMLSRWSTGWQQAAEKADLEGAAAAARLHARAR